MIENLHNFISGGGTLLRVGKKYKWINYFNIISRISVKIVTFCFFLQTSRVRVQ